MGWVAGRSRRRRPARAPGGPLKPVLILASTSVYRRELLSRLGLPFSCEAPGVDEVPRHGEAARDQAVRLAQEKARAVARRHPGATIIGSDQVGVGPDGSPLTKPGTLEAACAQLASLSGASARFHTAVAVVTPDGRISAEPVESVVRFQVLSTARIRQYLAREQALDCAGSFKAEGLGIALIERIDGDDPTALIGLPLIATTRLLRAAGLDPLR